MDAITKVSKYLGINDRFIRVQEWAKVYWVCIKGQRPTLLSKKMVDRAAELEVKFTMGGEPVIRDNRTGDVYILRKPCYGVSAWSIKKASERISSSADFSQVKGQIFRAYAAAKPSNLRELMIRMVAIVA